MAYWTIWKAAACWLGTMREDFSRTLSLLRQESRGVFIRQDHLYTDNENFLARTSYRQGSAVLVPVEQDAIAPSKGRLDYFDGIQQLLGHLSYGKEDAE